MLQRISNGLRSIRRLLTTEDRQNLETAWREEEELRRNLIRVRNLISYEDFQNLEHALDVITNKMNKINARLEAQTGINENNRLPRIRNATVARRGSFYDIDRNKV